ncbi:ABC transporter ATP-binding protein [Geodermatophilus sp. SYSU D00697]
MAEGHVAGTVSDARPVDRPAEPVLRVRDLDVAYPLHSGEQLVALEGATFDVAPGSFVSLVGPSGCGKSTLLNVVGGLVPRTAGSVRFHDAEVDGPSSRMGMMFQSSVLFPWRTVLANVLVPVDVARQKRSDHEARARELLEAVGLGAFAKSYPKELSGGMRQRVALCRLLLQDPEVMLLDEPFGALDEFTRESMNLLLLDFWQGTGKTVLFVTHNIQEAVFLSDRVVVMTPRPGRIARVLDIDLPRPRQISDMKTPRFQEYVFDVRALLGVS